jgi:hypothetical protein
MEAQAFIFFLDIPHWVHIVQKPIHAFRIMGFYEVEVDAL